MPSMVSGVPLLLAELVAAFQDLSRAQTPATTSALNVIQRVSGPAGTALLAVFLQRAIATRIPGQHGDLQRIAMLPHGQHLHLAGTLADAFGTTFWIAAGLTAAAISPGIATAQPVTRRNGHPSSRCRHGRTAYGQRLTTSPERRCAARDGSLDLPGLLPVFFLAGPPSAPIVSA